MDISKCWCDQGNQNLINFSRLLTMLSMQVWSNPLVHKIMHRNKATRRTVSTSTGSAEKPICPPLWLGGHNTLPTEPLRSMLLYVTTICYSYMSLYFILKRQTIGCNISADPVGGSIARLLEGRKITTNTHSIPSQSWNQLPAHFCSSLLSGETVRNLPIFPSKISLKLA